MRMRVTDIKIAAHAGTSLSKNMGRDYMGDKRESANKHLKSERNNKIQLNEFSHTSIAIEFPINNVQSKRCWFFTTGNILAADNKAN